MIETGVVILVVLGLLGLLDRDNQPEAYRQYLRDEYGVPYRELPRFVIYR